jgi:hypothetical protein
MNLASLRSAGFDVSADAGQLHVKPASSLTDGQRASIRLYKHELLRELYAETEARKTSIRAVVEAADLKEFRVALKAGNLHVCGNCTHFTFAANPIDAGTCSKFGPGLAAFHLPFWCSGFERSANPPAPEYAP